MFSYGFPILLWFSYGFPMFSYDFTIFFFSLDNTSCQRTGRSTLKEVGLRDDDLLHAAWPNEWIYMDEHGVCRIKYVYMHKSD